MTATLAPPRDRLLWQGPSPLWPALAGRPAVLRFASDDFVTDLERVLADSEGDLASLVARPETWHDEAVGPFAIPAAKPGPRAGELTLYQPVHGRFYLVAATLVCRRPGFPDRRMTAETSTGFVLRRLVGTGTAKPDLNVPNSFRELAWTAVGEWVAGPPTLPAEGEEVLPLAPVVFQRDGRRRRLLTGLIPVAGRERYARAPQNVVAENASDPLRDARQALVISTVMEPLLELHERARQLGGANVEAAMHDALVFALLDLADALDQFTTKEPADIDALGARLFTGPTPPNDPTIWREAVAQIAADRDDILAGDRPALAIDTLDTGDKLAAALGRLLAPPPPPPPPAPPPTPPPNPAVASKLASDVLGAILANRPGPVEPPPDVLPSDEADAAWYAVRCVHQHARCEHPRPEWVSELSQPFHLAAFFDPNAPVRDLSIPLPFDTSPAGLRRFPRNVRVQLSQELRRQMSRASKVTQLEDGELDSPSISFGMVCTLSIPIITICALLLLMIIVSLLNIVFWWLPLFKICLPLPRSGP